MVPASMATRLLTCILVLGAGRPVRPLVCPAFSLLASGRCLPTPGAPARLGFQLRDVRASLPSGPVLSAHDMPPPLAAPNSANQFSYLRFYFRCPFL